MTKDELLQTVSHELAITTGQLVGLARLLERLRDGERLTDEQWTNAISSTWESILEARRVLLDAGQPLDAFETVTP